MRDSNGASRGSGFVAFKTAEEASRAVSLSCKYYLGWDCHDFWHLKLYILLVVSYVALRNEQQDGRQ
jgi:hypothetical protein